MRRDHGDPGDAPSAPPPLAPVVNSRRPSAAEEARTVAASTNTGTLASGRITLAGEAERPLADELTAARDAHLAAVAAAQYYIDYSDFSLWVLRVHRVRWVGGYGRMDSATGVDRYGLDLRVGTTRGIAYTRVGFADPIGSIDELRFATVELVQRTRTS